MKTPLLLALPLLITACATAGDGYPSLLPRPTERNGFDEPAVMAPAPTVADPALDARLRELDARISAVAHGYDADHARAERGAAAPGARTVGSEAWLTAQTVLAALDDWRAQASSLASDLETLAGERLGTAGTAYPALDALQARAAAESERETQGIAAISARLPTS